MLSKEQANQIADELLSQERSCKFGFPDPSGIPVPIMYRCRDLRSMPNGLQAEVVRQATKAVTRSPLFLFFLLAWILALVALAFWLMKFTSGGKAGLVPALGPLTLAVTLGIRSIFVRRSVKLIAAQLQQAWRIQGPN